METPSSMRRITRSQAKAIVTKNTTSNAKPSKDSEMGVSKSRQKSVKQDRSALIDITNGSPIVGLASGSLKETPISSVSKQRSNCCKKTPGSGEALLRGQVKNLLHKVEEEAEITKFCLENYGPLRCGFKAVFNSPAGLAAPTPVNTPQILNFSVVEGHESSNSVPESPIEDQLILPQVMSGCIEEKKQTECEKDQMISRTLFLDFFEKSDSSSECSSVVTYQGLTSEIESGFEEKMASIDDDDASIWSIQVNASTRDEDEDEDEVNQEEHENDDDEYYDDEGEEEEDELLLLDELCEGISNMSVDGEKKGAKFMGKHTRFVYNSDDELIEEFEESDSTEILRLKGLPTPKGKHVRFQDDGEEDED